jgi:predicted permease
VKLPDGFRRTTPPDLGGARGETEEEIRFHIESRVDELLTEGMTESEARRRAHTEFGDAARTVRRAERESRGGGRMMTTMRMWLEEAVRDVRLAGRQARRNPGLWLAAMVTLALGVGGTTAVYSVVHGVLVRPLPYPDEDRVVRIWATAPGDADGGRQAWSVPDLEDWRDRSESVAAMGVYTARMSGLVVPTSSGAPEEIQTAWVTSGFFESLGTAPALGGILPAEAEDADPRVVVLSHAYWQRRFGGDPTVVGDILDAQAGAYRIAGVMPPGFAFPDPGTEAWTFLANVEQSSVPWELRQVRVFDGVARLAARTGDAAADRVAATQELEGVARSVAEDLPETNGGITGVALVPIRTAVVGDVRTPLLIVMAAVALTLLIACTNVANLLLARGSARRKEFEVRASLGAGRSRLVRQVLAESLVMGLMGGAAGVAVAVAAVPVLVARAGVLIPRSHDVAVDGPVLLVSVAVAIGTGLIVGLLPSLRAGRGSTGTEAAGARGTGERGEARRLLDGLVFAEAGLAVVLLVGGGLLMRSFVELRSVDPGFDAEGLLVADLVVHGYDEADGYMDFRDRFLEEIEAIPGVLGATTVKEFPTRGLGEAWPWRLPGEPEPPPGEARTAQAMHVHREFFDVMRIPLLAGSRPGSDREMSLIVNERLATAAFGSVEGAIGRSLVVAGQTIPVRAVVGDVLHADPSAEPPPMIYVDDRINARRVFSFIVRTDGEPLALAQPFTAVLTEMDARQPIRSLYTARSAFSEAVGQPRFFALLMSLFAAGAAVLAAVGIYGVVAYSVRRRTREIGLRLALGAERADVRRMVIVGALRPVLGGLVVGLVTAAALSSLLRGMLFGVRGIDPGTYGMVALGFALVALLAAAAPAREATRVDPRAALRAE